MAGSVDGSARELPVSCSLSGAERIDGGEEMARALFAGCRRVSELEDGYAFEFPGSRDQVEALARFITTERDCCPFFTFELVFEPDRGPVRLRMRGPRGAREFIRENMDEEFARKHEMGDRG